MFHRTPRLFLRPPFPEDRDAVMAAVGAAPSAGAAILQGTYASSMKPFARQFVIVHPGEDGAPVIGLASLLERAGALEIRLVIGPDYRDNGYGTEALKGLIEIAGVLGFDRVTATHCTGESAADRLLESTGFVATGSLVDNDDCCPEMQAMVYQWSGSLPHGRRMVPLAAA